ncbi:MAG: hypothetical protein FWG96_07160 [Methanomassiliicoccaceae archaeon]|nr:hypothetical protein [Methanomassiliicoccaceae archaeon]
MMQTKKHVIYGVSLRTPSSVRQWFYPITLIRKRVAYVDVDGSTGYTSVTPTAITGGETGLTSGWYYADGTTFTYATTINVSGDVHLIIANDCTMNTFYVFGQGGFTVTPGSNLWIYSQPEEAGHDIGRADESAGIAIILQSGSSFTNTAAVTALMQGVFSASAVTVTNGVTGTIEGTEQGVWLDSGGTVVNSGTINGTNWDAIYSGGSISISNDSGGTIQGGQYGIHTLGGGIVTNSGAIVGNDYYGIFAEGTPFSVTNNFGSLIQGGDIGILIDQDGYVNNSGTIEGFTQQGWNGSGIVFVNGNGTVVNSGTITGHLYNGIYAELADVHITNEVGGTIQGPNNGINLGSGGTVINNNVIYGGNYNGIYAYDGQGISPSVTVTNASSGTIEGGNRGIFLDADVAGNIDNEGRITGNIYYGIHAVTSANVENNTGGVITGPGGVYIGNFASGDEIENSGLIQGTMFSGIEINAGSDILITNNAAGIISGERYGIYLNVSGSVHNLGGIAGNLCGICAEASANIENDTGGVITGPSGVYIGAGSTGDEIENSGLIQGTMFSGIEINAGSDILITNNAAGIISGERNGIYLNVSSQVHNEGGIAGNLCGIYAEASANIENDTGGVITGPSGVYIGNFASGDEIENSGLIQGMMFSGIEINAGSDFLITNNAAGIISGERYGVCLNVHGSVYNEGGIAGNLCGVYAVTSAAIDNAAASIITGPTGVYIGVGSTGDEIENSGLIQGTMFSGIEINAGSDFLITNNAAGIISGDRYGIYFFVSGSVYNEGGIAGNLYGIYAEASANIENDTGGVITGPSGVYIGAGSAGDKIENSGLIQGTVWDGIYLVAGGEVYNYGGEIKGNTYGIRANAGTVIENWDLITGDVLLSNDVNRAAFAADSVIDGNFTIGSNANSALDFIGSPNLVTMVYATVNGAADIGAAAVDIDSAGPPAGMLPGGKMILIDGSAGTMSGTPANPTLAVGGYDLRISVVSDQLIAEVFIPVVTMNYVITATSDSMTSISPNGKTAVQKGNDITFVFSANTGFYIDAVIVDGVQLSQTDIRRGSYSFYNVDMNHSIQVTGRTTRVGGDITLNIGAIEGRGYAEYSVDGGVSFTRYTSTVVLSENTDLIIRAVAEGGYEFKEWREGSDVYKTSVVTFYSNAESVDMVLCFSGGDSAGYWIWIAAVIAVALILLISAFLIFGRKNS